jgi:hypothetical protein
MYWIGIGGIGLPIQYTVVQNCVLGRLIQHTCILLANPYNTLAPKNQVLDGHYNTWDWPLQSVYCNGCTVALRVKNMVHSGSDGFFKCIPSSPWLEEYSFLNNKQLSLQLTVDWLKKKRKQLPQLHHVLMSY